MSEDFSKYTNQQLMQMISPETARNMSTAELMRVAGIPEDNFKYHNLEQEVIKNQPAPTLKKKKSTIRKHAEKIADEIGGLGETLGYAATTIGAMPLDIAQFGYGMAKSITQEDLSRENIHKNMSEETPASILRKHLVVQPRTERGQAMVKSIEEAIGSPGNIAHDAIMKWGKLGGYDDKTSEQFAGAGSVAADLIPWVVGGKMVHAAKPVKPAVTGEGIRWGIGENKSPSNFELGETGDILTPKRPANMPPAPVQEVRQPTLALPEPASATGERLQRNVTEERLAERQAGMEEALAADDAILAEEMAKGRENPTQYRLDNAPPDFQPPLMEVPSNTKGDPLLGLHEAALDSHSKGLNYDGFRKQVLDSEGMQIYHGGNVSNLLTTLKQNGFTGLKDFYEQAPFKQERIDVGRELVEGLEKQKSGEFNHDAIAGDTVVTARDSLAVPATAKPVVKGTVAEVHNLIKDGTVNAKEHSTFYPEGMGNPDSPAYIIRKNGITKPLREVQLDLFNGKESEHLGYPERVGDGTDVTAAVTKQGEVLTDPNAIKLASADKEVAWASEGKAEEVVSKAQEVGDSIKDNTSISDMSLESDTQVLPKDEVPINDERVGDLQQEQLVSNNGSGESAASLEAQSRLKSQERSRFYAISKGGKVTELPATVDRVDIPTPKGGAIYEVTELGARRVDGELSISQRKLDNLVDRYRSAETKRLTQEVEAQEQKLREQDKAGGKVYDLSEEMLSEETPESYIERAFTDTGDFSGAADIGGMIDDILRGNPEVEMNMGIDPIKQSKALVDAIDKTWFERTSWATRNFFRSTRTTQFLAEKIPVLKDLYKMFGRRREYRYGIEYDLFKGGEDGVGVSKGMELYDSLSHQEKIDFDYLIYASDARDIFHDYTPRADGQPTSLETSNNVIGRPVSPKVAELYGIYKQVADKVVKALDEGRKDLALSFYEKSPYYNELKRILYDREFRDEFIEDPVESAKVEQEAIHNYLDESGLLYNEGFVKQLDKLSKDFGEIEATSEAYAMKAFYAHRARERGDLFLRVYPKINGEVKTNVPVFSRMVNSIADYRKLKRDIEKDPEGHFPINFKDYKKSNPDVEWVVAEPMDNPQPSESVYLFSGSKPANIAKLQRALDNVKESGKMDEALRDELGNELVKEFSKITAARGFGRTGLARETNFIEGHNRENYWGQMIDFIEGMAGSISKARFTADALNLVKDAKPEHVPFLEELIRLNLENKNSPVDAVGATVRSAIAAIYLSFRPVSFVLNATQNLSMGIPELNSRLRGLGLKTNGDTALAQVWAEMLKNVITRSDFVGEDRAFLDWFSRKGADQAQFVNEIGGLRDRGVNRAFQKGVGAGLWAFGKVESVMNREALGLASYRRLREGGMDVESARGLAKEISDVAHGDMSPENLPLLAQKGGMPARTALALRRFTIHQLNWLFNRVSQKEFAPVGRFLVTQAALGGVMATPLFMVINDVLERRYGKSPLLEIKKYIHDQLQDNPDAAQVVDDLVIKGIPAAALGIDISRNIGVELPYMFEEGDNSLAEKLGGAYYTYGSNVGKGIERIGNGQPLEGISKILPPGLGGDMMKAYLGSTRGMRDIQGRPLVDSNGKPIMYNAKEAIGQAGGFVPTRLNQARLLRTSELNISNYIKARADKLANRVRNAEADGDKEAARIHQKRFEEFLKKVEKEYPGLSRRTGRIKQSDISQTTKKNLSYEENLLHIKKPKVTEDINIDMSDMGGF